MTSEAPETSDPEDHDPFKETWETRIKVAAILEEGQLAEHSLANAVHRTIHDGTSQVLGLGRQCLNATFDERRIPVDLSKAIVEYRTELLEREFLRSTRTSIVEIIQALEKSAGVSGVVGSLWRLTTKPDGNPEREKLERARAARKEIDKQLKAGEEKRKQLAKRYFQHLLALPAWTLADGDLSRALEARLAMLNRATALISEGATRERGRIRAAIDHLRILESYYPATTAHHE
jgi:hypothetical protein